MQDGPNIARIAAVIGERGRAQVLTALMDGRALTATELADAAGVARSTMSSHLSRLQQARLIAVESQGRHRYFRIANPDVAEVLEGMMGLAQLTTCSQVFGPGDPASATFHRPRRKDSPRHLRRTELKTLRTFTFHLGEGP